MMNIPTYEETVAFHGHSCPGLAMGYRVALAALRELGAAGESGRAVDEELVALAENDSCSVDAVQFVTGCTLGKGNLKLLDRGKHAYTFWNRDTGKGARIYLEPFFFADESRKAEMTKAERVDYLLRAPEAELLKISAPLEKIPDEARIRMSRRCDACGELAMDSKLLDVDGRTLCLACAGRK